MAFTKVIPQYIDFTGATSGQVLTYNGTNPTWVTPKNITTDTNWAAKGNLIVGTADDTAAILSSSAVNNQVLTVDTSTATGLKWATPTTASRQETLTVNTSTSTSQAYYETGAFSFVVGLAYIEYLAGTTTTSDPVLGVWVNLRSFNGTKTADITNRIAIYGNTTAGDISYFLVDRNTSGTKVRVNRPVSVAPATQGWKCTGGLCSPTSLNWDTTWQLRVTAFEDTQS